MQNVEKLKNKDRKTKKTNAVAITGVMAAVYSSLAH